MKDDVKNLGKEFDRLQGKLLKRDSEVKLLKQDRVTLVDKLTVFEQKKQDWKRSSKQIEEHFESQLE